MGRGLAQPSSNEIRIWRVAHTRTFSTKERLGVPHTSLLCLCGFAATFASIRSDAGFFFDGVSVTIAYAPQGGQDLQPHM